ncbi:hypothetical protein DINM_006881 [Dirofilaria immitis]|nr:hypothetical protein [Dirofilaria immitis]
MSHCSEKRSVTGNCGAKYYSCGSGECIPREKACNRHYDCVDGSDEMKCEYFLAAQRAHSKSANAINTKMIGKLAKIQKPGMIHKDYEVENWYKSDNQHIFGYGKTGQYNNSRARTRNSRRRNNGYGNIQAYHKATKSVNDNDQKNINEQNGCIENANDRNGDKWNRNDKQNDYNHKRNTVNNNRRNKYHRGILNYEPSENHRYRELNSRISGVHRNTAGALQRFALNGQNTLNEGSSYEPNGLFVFSAINGSHTDSLSQYGEGINENYHSGTNYYDEVELRDKTNQTSYINGNDNGINGKDDEDLDECSDQEFRCPYLAKTLCVHYLKICDGIDDCGDGSDEMNCADDEVITSINGNESINIRCDPDQFRCENGKCIAQIDRCNRKYDCDDGTDETTCEYFVQALQQARGVTVQDNAIRDDEIPNYTVSMEQKYDQVKEDKERRMQEEEEQERLREQEEERERQEQERRQKERERMEQERIRQEYDEKERQRQYAEQERREKEYEREQQERLAQKHEEWEKLGRREEQKGQRKEEERLRQEQEKGRQEQERRQEEEEQRRQEERERIEQERLRQEIEQQRREKGYHEERREGQKQGDWEQQNQEKIRQETELGQQEEEQRGRKDEKQEISDSEWKRYEEEQRQRYEEDEKRRQEELERKRQEEKEDWRRLEEDRRRLEEDRRHLEELSRIEYGVKDDEGRREPEKEGKSDDAREYEKQQMSIEGVRIQESEQRRRLELEQYGEGRENRIDEDGNGDNGYTDADARDEYEVVETGKSCTIHQYRCVSGECIDRNAQCDGKTDCSDGSDEIQCHHYHHNHLTTKQQSSTPLAIYPNYCSRTFIDQAVQR